MRPPARMPSRRRSQAARSVTRFTGQTQEQKTRPPIEGVEPQHQQAPTSPVVAGQLPDSMDCVSSNGSVSGNTPSVMLATGCR
jgi:hypothetical protein